MVAANTDVPSWESNLVSALETLADLEFQRRVWRGLDPDFVSCFDEVYNVLYDDCDFEGYILYYKSRHGRNAFFDLLVELDQQLKKYESSGTTEFILNDPKWIAITVTATEVVAMFVIGH